MSDLFDAAVEFLLGPDIEGGWANVPGDPGKETYCGISRKAHPEWTGWPRLDATSGKNRGYVDPVLDNLVKWFYRTEYWDKIGGDQLPPKLGLAMFVWAVHSNPPSPLKALQRVSGLTGAEVDGVMGSTTLRTTMDYMDRHVAEEVFGLYSTFLTHWLASDPGHEQFRNGFNKRLRLLADRIRTR